MFISVFVLSACKPTPLEDIEKRSVAYYQCLMTQHVPGECMDMERELTAASLRFESEGGGIEQINKRKEVGKVLSGYKPNDTPLALITALYRKMQLSITPDDIPYDYFSPTCNDKQTGEEGYRLVAWLRREPGQAERDAANFLYPDNPSRARLRVSRLVLYEYYFVKSSQPCSTTSVHNLMLTDIVLDKAIALKLEGRPTVQADQVAIHLFDTQSEARDEINAMFKSEKVRKDMLKN